MANFYNAFQPESGINLDDLVGIFAGTTDPSVVGEAAPVGSLFIRSTGLLYQKYGEDDTEWIVFSQALGEAVKISQNDQAAGYLSLKIETSASLTQTIMNAGGNETLRFDLANVGTPGTYRVVTVNAKGQVVSGLNPTTLSGYGIVDAQPLNANLTAITTVGANGLYARTANGAAAVRTITGTSGQIEVTNGDGVAGNPTLSFPSSGLSFPGTEGIQLPLGTTAERVDINGVLRFNDDTNAVEYYNGSTWVSLVASTGGTVTSVGATVPEGLSVAGSPITTSGNLVFSLANDLAAVEGLTGSGYAVRTGTDTWATRTLTGTASRITVADGAATNGDTLIDIAADYAGQTSINTLGIVTTGTWAGTTIGTAFGGTGRTTIGSANQVLAVNTTGTNLEYKSLLNSTGISIAYVSGNVVFTNTGVTSAIGTANQVIVSSATGPVTFSLPQSIGTTSSPTFAQITLSSAPTSANQVATKGYVDGVAQGLRVRTSVRVSTIAPITLAGEQTIDGVAVVAGDRVLVKDQTTASQNGVYIVDAGSWVRADDLNEWAEVPNSFVFIEEGDTLADTGWLSTANTGGTLETTAIPWVQFSSAGVIVAGAGLTKTGNTLSITPAGTAGTYNHFTTNALGQVVSGSLIPYLTANQNITLQGDVTAGPAGTLLTTTLASTGITPGTYRSVTVDAKGRVYLGTNPTTIADYELTDAQPLNSYLTSLSGVSTNGFVTYASGIAVPRTIIAGSSKVDVTHGDGVLANPTIDVVPSNIDVNSLSGVADIAHGGTGLSTLGTPYQFLTVSDAGTALEYRTLTTQNITVTYTAGGIELATVNNGTVTSVNATSSSSGLTVTGGPITSTGSFSFSLDPHLQGLVALGSSLGLVVQTGAGTYGTRTVVSGAGTLQITNAAGTGGNIGIDLANIGTPGTYYSVTTDVFGRVLSGGTTVDWAAVVNTPTTLSGYGIADAQPLNSFLTSVANSSGSGIVVKSGGLSSLRSIIAGSAKITVANGSGVTGNPTIDLGTVLLGDLANVSAPAPSVGDSLVWNGGVWTNGAVTPKLYAENEVNEVTPVATGSNAIALGSEASAEAHDSVAIGRQSLARHPGVVQANGRFASQGDAQHGTYILRTSTINGMPGVEMFFDGVGGAERLTMTTDTTWVWEATIVAHRFDAQDSAGFRLKGVLTCGSALNSIQMLGAPSKEILARSQSGWDVAAVADPINGSLKITVKGTNGQTVRWMAVVSTTEVTN